jgi:hypothetical protein
MKKLTGERLNATYKVGAVQARYRKDGVWYHPLNKFPGALFEGQGYILFKTEHDYRACYRVKKGPDANHIHVHSGISSIPGYVKLARNQ